MEVKTLAEFHRDIVAEAQAKAERTGQECWEEICDWFAVCRKYEVEDAGGMTEEADGND